MTSTNPDRDATLTPRAKRVVSGNYTIDLSNVHDDESVERGPWDDLVRCSQGVAEICIPGRSPLARPLPLGRLDDAVVLALGQWFGDETLRHWFAFREFPVEQGRVSWRLDPHIAILGDPPSEATRERAMLEIERLTRLHMTILTPRRDLRLHASLLVPVARTERAAGSRWLLRDMIVRVHPLLVPEEDEAPPTERADAGEDTLNERHTRTLAR
jgi:hypothetical protein